MCHLQHRSIDEFAAMSVEDARALVLTACELHDAAPTGSTGRALQGRRLALLCSAADVDVDDGAVDVFRRAAAGLGAQVARLRSSLDATSPPEEVQRTARLLGRLYDGVECLGLPAELVRQIGAAAGVPVFEAISSSGHPTTRLADARAEPVPAGDGRLRMMQAVLVAALR